MDQLPEHARRRDKKARPLSVAVQKLCKFRCKIPTLHEVISRVGTEGSEKEGSYAIYIGVSIENRECILRTRRARRRATRDLKQRKSDERLWQTL